MAQGNLYNSEDCTEHRIHSNWPASYLLYIQRDILIEMDHKYDTLQNL